jgi:hypothetical protein
MPQIARPVATVSRGGWVHSHDAGADLSEAVRDVGYRSNLHGMVFEGLSVPDDESSYLRSPDFAGICELPLSTAISPTQFFVTDPLKSTGHILWARLRKEDSLQTTVTFRLMQGAVQIASKEVNPGTSWETMRYVLSGAEADAITNYNDLRIRLDKTGVADSRARVTWFELEVPGLGEAPQPYEAFSSEPQLASDGVSWRRYPPFFPVPS